MNRLEEELGEIRKRMRAGKPEGHDQFIWMARTELMKMMGTHDAIVPRRVRKLLTYVRRYNVKWAHTIRDKKRMLYRDVPRLKTRSLLADCWVLERTGQLGCEVVAARQARYATGRKVVHFVQSFRRGVPWAKATFIEMKKDRENLAAMYAFEAIARAAWAYDVKYWHDDVLGQLEKWWALDHWMGDFAEAPMTMDVGLYLCRIQEALFFARTDTFQMESAELWKLVWHQLQLISYGIMPDSDHALMGAYLQTRKFR